MNKNIALLVMRRLTELLEHDVLESLVRHELHPAVELQTKVREDFIIGPSRGLLHDFEIFANLRLNFV